MITLNIKNGINIKYCTHKNLHNDCAIVKYQNPGSMTNPLGITQFINK